MIKRGESYKRWGILTDKIRRVGWRTCSTITGGFGHLTYSAKLAVTSAHSRYPFIRNGIKKLLKAVWYLNRNDKSGRWKLLWIKSSAK